MGGVAGRINAVAAIDGWGTGPHDAVGAAPRHGAAAHRITAAREIARGGEDIGRALGPVAVARRQGGPVLAPIGMHGGQEARHGSRPFGDTPEDEHPD